MTTQHTTCYCGQSLPYENCCKKVHIDQKEAKTAEQLMRARYSAFVVQNIDFLYKSFYVATRGFQNKKEIRKWAEESKWLQLQILRTNTNTVEFEAHYLDAQLNLQIHHEISRFKQTEGIWYYVDGDLLS
ncbi:YchJ family protein [Sphingobacterium faecium]|uniref:YchJ family protein n=1 Tax=Sphingobacterium faecium TaxID=34087 RepID=UPI00320A4578